MSTCEECGFTYEWKMFFNNHMRTVHGVRMNTHKVNRKRQKRISNDAREKLESYYHQVCTHPTLDEIKELLDVLRSGKEPLDLEKESVYWWFINKRKRRQK